MGVHPVVVYCCAPIDATTYAAVPAMNGAETAIAFGTNSPDIIHSDLPTK